MKKLISIFVCALASALLFSACQEKGGNPEYAEGEVYIFTKLTTNISVTVGEDNTLEVKVTPNDGSVTCRWILDDTDVIGYTQVLEYAFKETGNYSLRFEAEKDGNVNYRTFKLHVVE